jgi:S-adenosylmethionine hydrolase
MENEFMRQKVITLLSDFGLRDPYVAEMKAVILSLCPKARIVDITHQVDKFNIRMGAFALASAASYFPEGTVHVAVVDPGVGSERRPIIVETKRDCFVGPDNGVLMLAALKQNLKHVYVIEERGYMLPKVSRTFHGRDVFAPVAAYLALGVEASRFGKETDKYVMPRFAKPQLKKGAVFGEVLHVDDFGNIITNIPTSIMDKLCVREGGSLRVKAGRKTVSLRFCSAYGEVAKGKPLAIAGSHDFLEISMNQGNAARSFRVKNGSSLVVMR